MLCKHRRHSSGARFFRDGPVGVLVLEQNSKLQ
jgi:hypothetical protein